MQVLVLDTTTKSIKAYLDSAVASGQPMFTAHYADSTASSFVEGENDGVLNSLTQVTIVSAPAASTRRIIKEIVIYNNDSAPVNVNLVLDNNGTTRFLRKVALTTGGSYIFSMDSSTFDLAGTTHTATAKDTPINADEIAIWDSVSNTLKKATIASIKGGTSWTAVPGSPVRASNTTFTATGDFSSVTAYPFGKGMVVQWKESTVMKVGMISIPPTYSAPNTTFTIIGDTMASIDAGTLKYFSTDALRVKFAIPGSINLVSTDQSAAFYAEEPFRVIGADLQVGTAGTTNNTTVDINKGGTTMFTTKPTLATTVAASPTPFTADNSTSLALNDKVTIDIDAIQTTPAIDAYITLYIFPTRYLYL